MTRFRRFVPTLVLLAGAFVSWVAHADTRTIHFLTWPDYIDPLVVAAFEREHDARIEFTHFDSDEARDARLAGSAGRGFDLLMVNRLQLAKYARRGWLRRIPEARVPNRRHIDARWNTALGDAADYGLAYFWGTQGLAIRRDLYPDGISSWRELLRPPSALRGHVVMPAFTRELVAIALKANGDSANEADPKRIDAAGALLMGQKPHVRQYAYPHIDADSILLGDDVYVAPIYNGDALQLRALNDEIEYVLPEEGALLWADYLAVSHDARNLDLIHRFLDYLNEPEIAARQARWVRYASPNTAARALLDERYLDDPAIHPDADALQDAEWLEPLPPRVQRQLNGIGARLLLSP